MSATATTMTPEDNRVLLAAVAAAVDASRDEDERALFESKREIVLALANQPVLIAVDDGRPLSESGPAGRVLLAFSDDEAAAAWAGSRHPAAPAAEIIPSSDLGRPDRKRWMQWLRQGQASTVAVNPSGPLGTIVHASEVRTLRPRLLRRGEPTQAEHPWLDLAARAAERARAGGLLTALGAAIAAGDQAAFARVKPELPTLNRIGSLMWAAELQLLSGRHGLTEGKTQEGLHQIIYGSFAFGRFGDPYRCIDGLLEAGELLLAESADSGEWRREYVDELTDVLERLRIGYRDADSAGLLAAARQGR